MILLEIQHLSKEFPQKDKITKVLSDISFNVKKGECFTIIGPNGSGKTTLLRILGLLEPLSSGKLLYSGKDLTGLSKKHQVQFRRKFSFVRQKPMVLNTTVFNNIAYGLKVRKIEFDKVESYVKEMIERVGLKGLEKNNARTLSGGEMQRVAIAMNFIISPEVYILDEVSANLDPKNTNLLEKFIFEIKKDKEKTIIMSTHNRLEAIKFADRIGVLNEGKLIQIGTPEEVFKAPKDEFTAHFVGYQNIFTGLAHIDEQSGLNQIQINDLTITASTQKVGPVKVCIRPESILLAKKPPIQTSLRNSFKGTVETIRDLGNTCHVEVKCHVENFLISITRFSRENLNIKPGSEVHISFKATDVKCL